MKRTLICSALCGLLFVGCSSEFQTPEFSSVHLVLDSGDVSRPTVAVRTSAAEETVVWAWIRKDVDGWNVYASRLTDDGEGRSEPVRVNHIPGNASPHAQAPAQTAIGVEGNVYVAWTNSTLVPGRRFPASDLLFSMSNDGGKTWTEERAVNSDAGGAPTGHTFHNVQVLKSGTVLVSWIDSRVRDRISAMGAPSAMTSIDAASDDHVAMHMDVSDKDGRSVGSQIRIARSLDGGRTFVETAVVDHNACPCCRTNMAVSRDGRVYLSWRHEFENGARDMVIASSKDDGLTFSEPVRVSVDNWIIEACPHAGPGLAVNHNGDVHVSWYTGADSGIGLFATVSKDGGLSFSPRVALDTDQPVAHSAYSEMALGILAIASEQPGSGSTPRSIQVSLLSSNDGERVPFFSVEGRMPAFAGNGSISALAFENADVISSRIWRVKTP